jgi:alpha-ketoglutarate-dependent taurine dioxygenase
MIVHEATEGSRDVLAFVRDARHELLVELHRDGAVLLRGFTVAGAPAFQDVVRGLAPRLVNYAGGDSPRHAVTDKVYTSTVYPPALPIPLHNEMSYTRDYPALIAFYCEVAPAVDGETPLADCRAVLRALPAAVVERFRAGRLRYVQNLHAGIGLGKSWRDTFETQDAAQVEALLRECGAEFAWRPDGALRVAETVNAVITHAPTGAEVFFSQAHLWHVSSLDPKTRAALLRLLREDELYHACTYGDGTPIAEADLEATRRAFDAASVTFPWQTGDVLLVDNVLVAHGRRPFRGERRILVAMGAR